MKSIRKLSPGARFGMCVVLLALVAAACDHDAEANKERNVVNEQQALYRESQPVPKYDWSLPRHLWIQFYDAQNREVTTYSYITGINGGAPIFDCPSQGYALPRDTQLTNPLAKVEHSESVVEQAEPNGLFTGKNTDATVIFCLNPNGTLAPVYSELKVTGFPFPVKWVVDPDHPQGHFVRAGDSTINLNRNR